MKIISKGADQCEKKPQYRVACGVHPQKILYHQKHSYGLVNVRCSHILNILWIVSSLDISTTVV